MNRTAKLVAALAVLVVVVGVGVKAYRGGAPSTVDAAAVLAPTEAEDGGTEPVALPATPVLTSSAGDPNHMAITFGYRVGGAIYGYNLAFAFPPDVDKGMMEFGPADRAPRPDETLVDRRWSETRKAYLVAVARDLGASVPPLCVRAVLGPSRASLDLSSASLCVMQRDQDGRCHPSTLACGLIRR